MFGAYFLWLVGFFVIDVALASIGMALVSGAMLTSFGSGGPSLETLVEMVVSPGVLAMFVGVYGAMLLATMVMLIAVFGMNAKAAVAARADRRI